MAILNTKTAARLLAGLTSTCLIAACQSGTVSYKVASHEEAAIPVAVAVTPDATEKEDGMSLNQWGGTVPEARPTTPVDNGALGEIE